MNLEIHESFLNNVDDFILLEKIKKFRLLDFKNISDSDLNEEIYNVLCFNNQFCYLPVFSMYPSGTVFYRVRKLSSSIVPMPELLSEKDFWNPPDNVIKNYGRINKPNESLLYTAPLNPYVAIAETQIREDDFFVLIKYIAKEDVKTNVIGGDYDYKKLGINNKHSIVINEIYNNFLTDEFSKPVGVGTEYLYKVSEFIAKNFFDLPPRDMQDAWAYKSIQKNGYYNVCFRPNIAKEILELQGGCICKMKSNGKFGVYAITHPHNKDKKAEYYELGSEEQKKWFPEVITT